MLQHRWPCKKTNMIALHEVSKGVRFIEIKSRMLVTREKREIF